MTLFIKAFFTGFSLRPKQDKKSLLSTGIILQLVQKNPKQTASLKELDSNCQKAKITISDGNPATWKKIFLLAKRDNQNCTKCQLKHICSEVLEPQLRRLQTFKPKANGPHSLRHMAWIKNSPFRNRVLFLLVADVSGLAHSRLFEACIRFYWVIKESARTILSWRCRWRTGIHWCWVQHWP